MDGLMAEQKAELGQAKWHMKRAISFLESAIGATEALSISAWMVKAIEAIERLLRG